jgi:hypothetical protein
MDCVLISIVTAVSPTPAIAAGTTRRLRVLEGVRAPRIATILHLRTGNPAADRPALLAAVLADGTNLRDRSEWVIGIAWNG